MKRVISFLICIAVILCLAGCEKPDAEREDAEVAVIKIMMPENIIGFREALDWFLENNPDIQVKIIDAPSETLARYSLYVSAMSGRDSSVDIYWLNDEWIREFAGFGYISPLPDGTEMDHSQYIVDIGDHFEYDGRLYALPIGVDMDQIYYRSDLLDSAPANWEEVAEIAGRERADIPYGICIEFKDGADMAYNIIQIKEATGQPYSEVLELYRDRLVSGLQDSEAGDMESVFEMGDAWLLYDKVSAYNSVNNSRSGVRGKVLTALIPADKTGLHLIRGYGLGINSNSNNKEAAVKLLDYLQSPDVQKKISRKCSLMPIMTDLYTDEMVLDDGAHFYGLKDVIETAVSYADMGIEGSSLVKLNDILKRYMKHEVDKATAGALFEEIVTIE